MKQIRKPIFSKNDFVFSLNQKKIPVGHNLLPTHSVSSNWLQKLYRDSIMQSYWRLLTSPLA